MVGAWIALSPLYRLALEGSPVPLPPSGLAGGLFFMSVTAPVLAWVLLLLLGLLLAGLLVALCGVPFLIAARAIWNKRPPLEGQTAGERDAAPS
ncbi:MAG: hypothetical protein AVDCRST_MAG77-3292 [uncultured Chloroflexi bacterium]|uniref:Uncharacterized protein n=1 Tax=uncultured Chloroflexota bacterium TaxID=166587 RepID=A0A6J4J9B1_9CHLR|nr:MAG: hypothetical protein AVDCRST_MAG77-3292 [uncultured Chloroflexota bacterium]